jgi:hypothetical protein
VGNLKNCTACKVRGLATILVIGGLGVEDKPNGACEIPLVLHVISFPGIEPKIKFTDQY